MTVFQYNKISGMSEIKIICHQGYSLQDTIICHNSSWTWDLDNICVSEGMLFFTVLDFLFRLPLSGNALLGNFWVVDTLCPLLLDTSPMDKSDKVYKMNSCATTAAVVGVVCSIVFLAVGVVLGVVGLYLIQRVRGRLSGPTSSSPPPLPPPVTYEEVGVATEVKRSQDIQLTPNEAYGPILNRCVS